MPKTLRVLALSAVLWAAAAPVALAAQGSGGGGGGSCAKGDVSKIGDCTKGIVSPNAKAFWWICLVIGLLFMAGSRKASRAGGIAAVLIISGVAVFNPAGVGTAMQNFAGKII